jgi:hypothetical protein
MRKGGQLNTSDTTRRRRTEWRDKEELPGPYFMLPTTKLRRSVCRIVRFCLIPGDPLGQVTVLSVCDIIPVLKNGRLVATVSPADVDERTLSAGCRQRASRRAAHFTRSVKARQCQIVSSSGSQSVSH